MANPAISIRMASIRMASIRMACAALAVTLSAVMLTLIGLAPAAPARAQDLVAQPAHGSPPGGSSGFDFGNGDQPIDISADNGIEWNRDAKTYIARGNAVAAQGDSEIHAETLTASYTTDSNQIEHVVADGNVTIMNPNQTVFGDHADYDKARKLLVMTGHALKVRSTKETVTARDRLEYWQDRDVTVARGDVVIAKADGTIIRSDVATSYFRKNAATGKRELFQIQAEGNVHIDTKKGVVTCNRAVYDPNTEISVLTGNVVLTQNGSVFRGARAEIDSKSGVSRLFPGTGGDRRVHTRIQPKKNNGPAGSNPTNSSSATPLAPSATGAMAFDPNAVPQ